ncbi:MAG: UvrD-helicase domain-containing protein, partial [Parcubacteria group bacterium]|nr:UvrD-helicase domain-containing protein [Parcubacteria group bacterium]
GYTDFDGLFIDAINKIKKEGANCKIIYHGEKEIGDIKHILIDEYQDFSKLFYQLIDEIRNVNSLVSFFCVGDDWQAINGFAGSDLEYFKMFETEYFKGGRRVSLLTNHRSDKAIVSHSNLLMSGLGTGGEPEKNRPDGTPIYLSELLRVELRNDQEHISEYVKDKRYVDTACLLLGREEASKSIPLELARYLKTVEYIVNTVDTKKQVCLLFRTNKLQGLQISKFADKIGEWCPERQKTTKKKVNGKDVWVNIDYSTAHSFKGKERDAVIIVGANRRSFPKFHPDNELMEVLGVTMQKVRDEEQRLFYVAITRAKEELYLIYDKKIGMSDFIFPERWQYASLN